MGGCDPIRHRNGSPMTHDTPIRPAWKALPWFFAWAFTRPGFRRFAEWVTALAINSEEHTITQSVIAIERVADIDFTVRTSLPPGIQSLGAVGRRRWPGDATHWGRRSGIIRGNYWLAIVTRKSL